MFKNQGGVGIRTRDLSHPKRESQPLDHTAGFRGTSKILILISLEIYKNFNKFALLCVGIFAQFGEMLEKAFQNSSNILNIAQPYIEGNIMEDKYLKPDENGEHKWKSQSFEIDIGPRKHNSIKYAIDPHQTNENVNHYQSFTKAGQSFEGDVSIYNDDDGDDDIMHKINLKLIKNKNLKKDIQRVQKQNFQQNQTINDQDSGVNFIDKRSRSETPCKMSATEVLYRAHQKLQSRRKQSPSEVHEKQIQRQKKAEDLRSQIELSKKDWFEKLRIKQQIVRDKWQEMLAQKQAQLEKKKVQLKGKMDQAEERRESEIQSLKNKAKQEIQKIDETNYIVKMTMNNMKLDLFTKMCETQERRNQLMQEFQQKQQDRQLKGQAVVKRKQELKKESEIKFQTLQYKREQAELRRSKMLENKKRLADEKRKRELVLQRKNELGYKISDIMSFVSNSENIWEFLGNERDWQDLGQNDGNNILFDLISKDHFELEKMRLKKDAELLDQVIVIKDDGSVYSRKNLLQQVKQHLKFKDEDQSDSSDDEDIDQDDYSNMTDSRYLSPFKESVEELKTLNDRNEVYLSDSSEKEQIIMEDTSSKDQENVSQILPEQLQQLFTDQDFDFMLQSQRMKQSVKRNILKKTLSEDLTWSDFILNENTGNQSNNAMQNNVFQSFISNHHSRQSTPERKQEIPCESGKEQMSSALYGSSSHNSSKKVSSGKGAGGGKNNTNNNTSSSGNQSDKPHISNIVYPSKKKKNPNNSKQISVYTQEIKGPGSVGGKKVGGSNQSSTHSLKTPGGFSSGSFHVQDQLSGPNSHRRSTIQESISDTGKKHINARVHSSSVTEQTHGMQYISIQSPLQTIIDQAIIDDQLNLDQTNENTPKDSNGHTGQQMTSLIANPRPIAPLNKIIPKKLSVNAQKLLFPIREQKLLLKKSGKESQFAKAKIVVKIEDLLQQRASSSLSINQQTSANPQAGLNQVQEMNEIPVSKSQIEILDTSMSIKNDQLSPQRNDRGRSIDNNFDNSNEIIQVSPLTIVSKLQQPTKIEHSASKKNKSGGKNQSEINSPPKTSSKVNKTEDNTTLNLLSTPEGSTFLNEIGAKETIIKYLMVDNIQQIKTEESQKTIMIDGPEADKVIEYLQHYDMNLRYCRLCDLIIPDHCSNDNHVMLKSHKKTRDELGIKENEDMQYSIFTFQSYPGDIEKELQKEKEKALKRKVKRIKVQMNLQAISHESAAACPGKEITSANKKRFQILCMDLEKQVIPVIKDYETLEVTLKELIKLLDMRKQADLHVMRKLKFIPILMEVCKRISVCHKSELKFLGKALEHVIKIISTFCNLRENRNYMLQTNRLQPLIELLTWCLNRPTQLFHGIVFLPQLFHILTIHIKHKAPYECQNMRDLFTEYIVCSQITMKIKSKFQIINGPLDLSEMMGQVPLVLLKSATFIEALTSLLSMDAKIRPVAEKSLKVTEHVLFVIQNTEMFGILPMITTVLLSRNQPFKPSTQSAPVQVAKILPQTILSLAIISIKIINNIFRMDYRFAQHMLSDNEAQEQLYHLFNYLLMYTVETSDQHEDSKELLQETLLMIGYFCLQNEKHQQVLCKGENTILQKLCNLPFPYFSDKKLKEILFPTFIQTSYKNERSLAIMDQEMSIEMIVDYLEFNIKEELPKIVEEECDYQSVSSLGGNGGVMDRRTNRSPSHSSTHSSNCSFQMDNVNGNVPYLPLYMRFPKKLWKDAITFYSKVLY